MLSLSLHPKKTPESKAQPRQGLSCPQCRDPEAVPWLCLRLCLVSCPLGHFCRCPLLPGVTKCASTASPAQTHWCPPGGGRGRSLVTQTAQGHWGPSGLGASGREASGRASPGAQRLEQMGWAPVTAPCPQVLCVRPGFPGIPPLLRLCPCGGHSARRAGWGAAPASGPGR